MKMTGATCAWGNERRELIDNDIKKIHTLKYETNLVKVMKKRLLPVPEEGKREETR